MQRIALLGVLLVAGVLRFHHIGASSLWMDELFSLASSTARFPDISPLVVNEVTEHWPHFTSLETARPWWTIWTGMREGTHPPLYIVLLRFWREAAGEGDVAARALSVLASLVAIALLFDVGRVLYGPLVGLWAAALFALAQPQVAYGQEARPYAVLLAFAMGAWAAAARIHRDGANPRRLVALGACALAMALTHYFSFGALLLLGLWGVVALRERTRRHVLLALGAAAVLFLVLWGPSLWHQRHIRDYAFLTERGQEHVGNTLGRIDRVVQGLLVEDRYGFHFPGLGWGLLIAPAALAWWRRELLWPVAWTLATVLFIAALDLLRDSRHLEYIRYTLLAGPGLYLMIPAVCLGRQGGRGSRRAADQPVAPGSAGALPSHLARRVQVYARLVLPTLIGIYCLAGTLQYYRYVPGSERGDWRGIGETLRKVGTGSEPIVFASPKDHEAWFGPSAAMCLSHYAHADRMVVVLDAPASERVLRRLREHPRVLFVSPFVPAPEYLPGFVTARQFPGRPSPIQVLRRED